MSGIYLFRDGVGGTEASNDGGGKAASIREGPVNWRTAIKPPTINTNTRKLVKKIILLVGAKVMLFRIGVFMTSNSAASFAASTGISVCHFKRIS